MREARMPSIDRVARVLLVVSDLDESERFFADAFDFVTLERRQNDEALSQLMGLPGATTRQTIMRLGAQEIALTCFDPPGRANPPGSTSSDLWFQHFAIIVSDMAKAYARLEAAGRFIPITSGGPIKLPESSGGVEAFKFRDLDGHPLELLAFPAGKAPDAWKTTPESTLFLGIDHSAISVGDTEASIAFLKSCFGLRQSMQTENVGPEQARMDDVPDARVIVTGLAAAHAPPHVELLGYLVGERRPIDGATRSNDIAATCFVLDTDGLDTIAEALITRGVPFVSPGVVTLAAGVRAIAVLDPDGHRFIVEERPRT